MVPLQNEVGEAVVTYGWYFLAAYVMLILGLGYMGYKKTDSQDDYATARGGYGFLALALAYAATVASGSTFMGIPGMAYDMGFKAGYYAMIYPIGIYFGMLFVARITKKVGDRFGSQSVPDFLGDRFQSPLLRLLAALLSLFLLFYIMSQVVAAGWMFDAILGVPYDVGIWLAGLLLLLYLTLGGSHADILTDAVQGAIMIGVMALIVVMFVVGWGFDGGAGAVNAALESDQQWSTHTNPDNPIFASWWVIFLLFIAHIGFTVQPHLGNKFFAIKGTQYMKKFMTVAAIVGMALPLMFLGGVLGAAQGLQLENPDAVIPMLFIETLPPIVAAFLGVAILSAIISTADGLIIAVSQIFANDLYRKTYVPWKGDDPEGPRVDQRTLWISRASTVIVTLVGVAAVMTPPQYLSVLLWVGIGGIISALSGPYFIGNFWEDTSKTAAIAAVLIGFGVYFVIHLGPQAGLYEGWYPYNENPFASTGIGFVVSCVVTYLVSRFTDPLPQSHLDKVFRPERATQADGGVTESQPTSESPDNH
ncbi:sodium:solute symporter family protein [Halegenticoccus tardaugens]|uniref:sodium:solute symporter family protein n=1 Tax=Halegenticoccus tardaugens TaxID=2071624 RepID=UPI00100A2BDF|nr:sodium:solute symporter family protein [Halegenticoccus tardaugens]